MKRRRFAIGQLVICHCDPSSPPALVQVEMGGITPVLVGGHRCPTAELQPRKPGPRTGEPWRRITTSLPVTLLERARARGKLGDVIEQALRAYLGPS